ncbi:MAG: hypothetical protein AAB250_09360 [Bdellovibrionota bacterium]
MPKSDVMTKVFGTDIHTLVIGALAASMLGCVKSPSPTVGELIRIAPPTFTLSAGVNEVTIPAQTATLTGTCDPAGYGLSYAIDQTATWTPIPGDCVNGAFTLTVPVHRIHTIYARAKTKLTFTSLASIRLHYVPAPTSTSLSLVQSSTSNDDNPRNIQSAIGHTYSGESRTNGTVNLHSYLPAITYEQ